MSCEYAIEVSGLDKFYQIYEKPSDRLKQMLFQGRRKYYREFRALENVSFKIKKGQTAGIIGRNGSGKSTLLQIICGTLSPTSGSVVVKGRVAALLELGAGFNPEFTGIENVYMAAALYGLSRFETSQRLEAIIAFAEIGEHIHQPVKTYSSGMYVRLAFAVIAHVDADILVIDEALAVGDAFFTQKCMRFLRAFMEEGTVLFVSHDTAAVVNLCTHALWLEHGVLRSSGNPKLIAENYLATIYHSEPTTVETESKKDVSASESWVLAETDIQSDPRWDLINESSLRNSIEVFRFSNSDRLRSFGSGSARIIDVSLRTKDGQLINHCIGGEQVELSILIDVLAPISCPIVGFSFKDRLGQVLFGDNSYITYKQNPTAFPDGSKIKASFRFQLPILPQGDYSIAAAIATGTQEDHQQEHWIHDALILKSLSSSVSTGLVGIPMHEIAITQQVKS